MRKRSGWAGVVAALISLTVTADYREHPEAQAWLERVVARHDLSADEVRGLLASAQRQPAILDAIARPVERTLAWHEYRAIFLTEERIRQGVEFARRHDEALARAEERYGVPAPYILAILGVETSYGRNTGRHRVLDALATLAFDYPPRGKFFGSELEQFLLLAREQGLDPLTLTGSYAGAMGYGQFIASSYRHYAVDFDGDGVADLFHSPVDAIGSIANYLARHDWRRGEPVAVPAAVTGRVDSAAWQGRLKPWVEVERLDRQGLRPAHRLDGEAEVAPLALEGADGQEYWLGLHNFYAISRYNHSVLYAMAVHQLAEALEAEL